MALQTADMAPPEQSPWLASDVARAVLQFLGGVRTIPTVRKVAYSMYGGQLEIWVFQDVEDLDDAERIYLLERSMRQQAGLLPLNINVIPRDQVDERNLPPVETLLER